MISQHFKRSEFACRCGCGYDTVDVELIEALEDVRRYFFKPVTVNSGARCFGHNAMIGGSHNSQHLYGKAADFVVKGIHEDEVVGYLLQKYQGRFGVGRYNGRTHLDARSNKARWDKREVTE